jgi:hypothetical protein
MRYALVYGGIAGIIIIIVSTAFVSAGLLGHTSSPLMGYLAMLVGLTMIFVGVKRYRDVEQGGVIRFGKALWVGLGISLVAAIIYAAAFEIYSAVSGFDFVAHFSDITTREMQAAGASPAAGQGIRAQMPAPRQGPRRCGRRGSWSLPSTGPCRPSACGRHRPARRRGGCGPPGA